MRIPQNFPSTNLITLFGSVRLVLKKRGYEVAKGNRNGSDFILFISSVRYNNIYNTVKVKIYLQLQISLFALDQNSE